MSADILPIERAEAALEIMASASSLHPRCVKALMELRGQGEPWPEAAGAWAALRELAGPALEAGAETKAIGSLVKGLGDAGQAELSARISSACREQVDATLLRQAKKDRERREAEPLLRAASAGDWAAAEAALAGGAPIDARDETGMTALMRAVLHPETARRLIDAGASVHARTHGGENVAWIAAKKGAAKTLEILAAAGVDMAEPSAGGLTPLMLAFELAAQCQVFAPGAVALAEAERGAACVRLLLPMLSAEAIEAKDARGRSALDRARPADPDDGFPPLIEEILALREARLIELSAGAGRAPSRDRPRI